MNVEERGARRPWEESDLVTDWSAFPDGYGILLNERLLFPEDLCLWRTTLDTTRQLFVDDHLIAHRRGLKRQWHRPRDHPANPLLTGVVANFVGPDEQHGYRLHYGSRIAYSRDGVNWEKPDLNVCDRPADAPPDEPNNYIAVGPLGVLHEPDDPDERQRWKAIGGGQTQVTWPYAGMPPTRRPPWLGMKPPSPPDPPPPLQGHLHDLYVSPDGIRWTRKCATSLPSGPIRFHAPYELATGTSMVRVRWDPKLRTYVANTKRIIAPDLRTSPVFHVARSVSTCESNDLVHWSRPRVFAVPDGEDAKMSGMYGIYEASGFPYESMWLNCFSMSWYHPASEQESRQRDLMPTRPYIKRNRIRLAASRDGRHWYYVGDRRPFIDLGPEDGWKPHYLRMVNRHTVGGPVLIDDELWFYHRGNRTDGDKNLHKSSFGVAILRRDGFASLDAGEEAGVVITRPFVFEGEGRLFVNADVATNGCVRASVMAEDGTAISGFGEEQCQAVCADSTRSRVGWSGHETLAGLKDRYVRLALHVRSAKLYSFWIE